jgi:hypothetical protein
MPSVLGRKRDFAPCRIGREVWGRADCLYDGLCLGAHFYGRESYPGDSVNQYYKEDIFVGYRWYEVRKIAAFLPFGFGLSYTTFEYGKIVVDKSVCSPGDTVQVALTLKNTGRRAGADYRAVIPDNVF